MSIRIVVASTLLLAGTSAFGAIDPRSGSDAGPFPPRADPVLNGPAPPVIAPAFSAASANGTMTQPLDAPTIAALTRDPDAKRVDAAVAETELDRAERIAREEQARAASTSPVAPGAFNGETDPARR